MCDMSAGHRARLLFLGLMLTVNSCMAGCPLGSSALLHGASAPLHHINRIELQSKQQEVDFAAVKKDLIQLFTDSQEAWPADYGHYGGLFIRMAWHCTGSYRSSDGRGGCDGARQRFDPERSWKDNTNLDKARNLLQPIKLKYGPGLSWGDLMVLAGTASIESMGGPVLGFCAGRIDDYDGSDSIELGPSPEQQALAPCEVNGNCSAPLGQDTIGLIYVNPEGPMGEPKPLESAQQIRDVFGRMSMNDSETVALIGGGHAFGKTHGACPTGPGPAPNEDESNPWPGTCGSGAMKGKGPNTFTSGLEGPWTVNPTKWDNDYFKNLINYDWEVYDSPGGAKQWRPVKKAGGPEVPKGVMMLTTDVALIYDPIYLELVKKWANDIKDLEHAFSHAWYKLATRDMGPVTRCLGKDVPPAQDFQFPLPPTPEHLADFDAVQKDIQAALRTKASLTPDKVDGKPYYGALFATLAWQCASTFRQTDYMGGCNGARIRFAPQKDWPVNKGMDQVLAVLAGIKKKYEGKGALSWADLIVLAGQTAIEDAGGFKMKFCGGRTDDTEGSASANLAPRSFKDPVLEVKDTAKVMGLTSREVVALAARLRSPSQQSRLGYSGSWTSAVSTLSNVYYKTLLTEAWDKSDLGGGKAEYQAGTQHVYMLPTDLALKWNPVYAAIAQEYASDEATFKAEFAAAWTKVMNIDRFDGPSANLCNKPQVELHNATAGVMEAF